jgi:GntR family transcriptional regulator / MocR family aminotransferase
VAQLRAAIHAGQLPVGAKLPASRVLAADLRIARGVVVEAYQRLTDEGLVQPQPGAGTLVAGRRAAAPAPGPAPAAARLADMWSGPVRLPLARPEGIEFDLSPGVPDLSAFPRAGWLRAERAVLDHVTGADLGYGDPRGNPRLRAELSTWLARTRGVRAPAGDILVVAGVAQSLALLAQVLRARGTATIAVEDPGSRGARDDLAHWGLVPVPVPVDGEGLRVGDLAAAGTAAVVVTPAHQFPTGVVLSPARRRALLDWAAGGGLVIEDDYDAEHRYDRPPVPAVHAAAPERVAYTGSTSKTLAPGMRLGWLVPPPELAADLVAGKHASDLGCPALPQLVLARLLATGEYDRHLRRVRARQRERRDALLGALAEHLPGASPQGVAAGLHVLLSVPGDTPDTDLAARAAAAGVLVQPLSWHRQRPGPPGLVLGYAALTADRLREAARRLAEALRDSR